MLGKMVIDMMDNIKIMDNRKFHKSKIYESNSFFSQTCLQTIVNVNVVNRVSCVKVRKVLCVFELRFVKYGVKKYLNI